MIERETIERSNLTRQVALLKEEFMEAISEVIDSGRYILGERMRRFEAEFAAYVGSPHAIAVASGTEALYLALKGIGAGEGEEVVTTPFTAVPTISAILMAGCRPVFADIDPATFNIDPDAIEKAITPRTRAIMPVHLYGLCAEIDRITEIADAHGVTVIEDAAQAHGSYHRGRHAGAIAPLGCYSFYPTKNLGAVGDAGMIVAADAETAERLRLLRNYGQISPYETSINGVNSRLDEIQAAILSIKLPRLEGWNARRRELAALYREVVDIPAIVHPTAPDHIVHNHHVYVVRAERRDELWRYLESNGVQSNVYYPIPAHLQKANEFLGYRAGDFPNAEQASREVLALPMYPELRDDEVETVAATIHGFYGTGR